MKIAKVAEGHSRGGVHYVITKFEYANRVGYELRVWTNTAERAIRRPGITGRELYLWAKVGSHILVTPTLNLALEFATLPVAKWGHHRHYWRASRAPSESEFNALGFTAREAEELRTRLNGSLTPRRAQ